METPRIMVLLYREDDPSKNTALKLVRMGFAVLVSKHSVRGYPLVLNPYSNTYLGPWYRNQVLQHGVLVLDASWKKLSKNKFKGLRGEHVKLPPLLPGNPINYGKPCMLSSIEAVAATLYITGFQDLYKKILGVFKWMNTFDALNKELLDEYARVSTLEELREVIVSYWEVENPCIIQEAGEAAEA